MPVVFPNLCVFVTRISELLMYSSDQANMKNHVLNSRKGACNHEPTLTNSSRFQLDFSYSKLTFSSKFPSWFFSFFPSWYLSSNAWWKFNFVGLLGFRTQIDGLNCNNVYLPLSFVLWKKIIIMASQLVPFVFLLLFYFSSLKILRFKSPLFFTSLIF